MSRFLTALFFCLFLSACGDSETDDRTLVDAILHNGKVITIDADLSLVSAVAVNGTDIVAVGGAELLESYKSANMVDLGGKVLMPGFIDSHTHLRGRPQRYVDLTKTRSIEELKAQVSAKAVELGAGEWITGDGWSEDVMAELRRPLRNDLDQAAPDNPVLLTRAGGHSAVANSMALRLAEVTVTTPQPKSGVIERGVMPSNSALTAVLSSTNRPASSQSARYKDGSVTTSAISPGPRKIPRPMTPPTVTASTNLLGSVRVGFSSVTL